MKTLNPLHVKEFSQRFEDFKDAEIRSLEILAPDNIKLTLAVQDASRDFDWITLTLDFHQVSDARLIEENKLQFLNTTEGFTLLYEADKFAFGVGACYNISQIQSSSLYLIAQTLHYSEGQF